MTRNNNVYVLKSLHAVSVPLRSSTVSPGEKRRPEDKEALLKLLENGFPKQLEPGEKLTERQRNLLRQALSGELDHDPDQKRMLFAMVARFESWRQAYVEITINGK